MFNIGLGELLFIAILALIFIGPERLPKVMRQLGGLVAQVRGMMAEVTEAFGDELKPIQEMRNLAEELKPMRQLTNLIDPRAGSPGSAPTARPTQAPPVAVNPMSLIGGTLAAPPAHLPSEPSSPPPDAAP